MPQVAESIPRRPLTEAERSTGLKIAGAYLGMAGEGINTQTNYSTVGISGASNPISEEDRDRALLAVAQEQVAEDRMVMQPLRPELCRRWRAGTKSALVARQSAYQLRC